MTAQVHMENVIALLYKININLNISVYMDCHAIHIYILIAKERKQYVDIVIKDYSVKNNLVKTQKLSKW